MKMWIISVGLLLLIILSAVPAQAYYCQADINGDGRVDHKDAAILNAEAGRDNCNRMPCQADLNSYGKVDSEDKKILKDEFWRNDCSSIGEEDSSLTTRFKDNEDGTVTDSKTGLMWTKNANLPNDTMLFHQALDYIKRMNEGKYPNFGYTDWRLSNLRELRSLIDYTKYTFKGHELPSRHPFENVQLANYVSNTDYSRFFSIYCRLVGHNVASCYGYVWPVRGGQEK